MMISLAIAPLLASLLAMDPQDPPADIVAEELARLSGKRIADADRLPQIRSRIARLQAELAAAEANHGAESAAAADIRSELRASLAEERELRHIAESRN